MRTVSEGRGRGRDTMEKKRCKWCNPKNELYIKYHDTEWGVPVFDDEKLFELLILEPFQAGLAWETVLNKRDAFRQAFSDFDACKISRYDEKKIEELMQNPAIIRNRRKIEAAVHNAGVYLQIKEEWGSFSDYLWHFTEQKIVYENDKTYSPLSDEVAADLKKRGMKFIGTTIVYSYLQAVGIINSHEDECFLHYKKDISFRMAENADMKEIMTLVQQATFAMEAGGIHQWDERYPMEEDFLEDLSQGNLYVGVKEAQIAVIFTLNSFCDEEYVKGTWMYPEEEFCVIHRLCVHPKFQNQGIAKRTLQYIEELLLDRGIQCVRLDVFRENPYAVNLYLHQGYSKVGQVTWRKGDFYLMEKKLVRPEVPERLDVNGTYFSILKLLGKGKGGYSYLATDEDGKGNFYVLKQIHHEPCDYYTFGDKIQSEITDYERLKNIGIRIPKMIDVDVAKERILKEYIDGPTIASLVEDNQMKEAYVAQVREMCKLLYPANTNIDYYPTNFVVQEELLYYIDYECNDYMEEWNFENWGIKYWGRQL